MSLWTSLEPASTTMDAGATRTVTLRLRNTGDVVDEYHFVPVGDLAPYATVEPATLRLYPGTTGTVAITFAPPRTPDSAAGPHPYGVQVVPTEHPDATTVAEGNITITPFTELHAELVPPTVKGRFRGRPKLAVDNLGNVKLTASVSGSDNGDQLSYEILPGSVQIEPGRAAFIKATLKPRQITWAGQKQERPYTLDIRRSGAEPTPVDGVYVQRGVLPYWLMTVLSLLLVLTITGLIMWFNYRPAVRSLAQDKTAPVAAQSIKPSEPAAPKLPEAPATPDTPAQPSPDADDGDGGGEKDSGGGEEKEKKDPASRTRVQMRDIRTDKCADILGREKGTVNGAVQHSLCNRPDEDNQLWNLEVRYKNKSPKGTSLFQIRNVTDELCMDLGGYEAVESGKNIGEFHCDGTTSDNQLWWLDRQPNGGDTLSHYWIRNVASDDMCLKLKRFDPAVDDYGKDAPLAVMKCTEGDGGAWKFITEKRAKELAEQAG
ncbi:ricin-type beta-trefoil lectin domain protein [Streptomyces sp. NPDC050509]|uniref:ricin-type beta-trefoil lectin domain protein n=1 Tax=Streptomyces sp. NPDC050509 TaxID=3365620 RepID=UPI00379BD10F